jgi:hypothetical protein
MDLANGEEKYFKRVKERINAIVAKINIEKIKNYEALIEKDKTLSVAAIKKYLRSELLQKILETRLSEVKNSANNVLGLIQNKHSGQNQTMISNLDADPKHPQNFIQKNIMSLYGNQTSLRNHKEFYKGLVSMNIPMLQKDTALKRRELYDFYTLFNALCIMTSQRYDPKTYRVSQGIDYEAFRNGMTYIFMQSTEISKRLFESISEQFSGNFRVFLMKN